MSLGGFVICKPPVIHPSRDVLAWISKACYWWLRPSLYIQSHQHGIKVAWIMSWVHGGRCLNQAQCDGELLAGWGECQFQWWRLKKGEVIKAWPLDMDGSLTSTNNNDAGHQHDWQGKSTACHNSRDSHYVHVCKLLLWGKLIWRSVSLRGMK